MLFILKKNGYYDTFPLNITAFLPVCKQKAVKVYLKTGPENDKRK